MRKKALFIAALSALLLLLLPTVVFAGTQTFSYGTVEFKFITPEDFGWLDNCPSTVQPSELKTDGFAATNLALKGNIIVQAVTDGGIVNLYTIAVNVTPGNELDTIVGYPAINSDLGTVNGIIELHVDIQIGVEDGSGNQVEITVVDSAGSVIIDENSDVDGIQTTSLGPGNDWDVFCLTPPPPPPSSGDEGCTPGYWKNHLDSWVSFTPDMILEGVFSVPNSLELGNNTLLEALNFGGGPGQVGAAKILFRAAVAAILNASSSVDYPRSVGDIMMDTNQALASGNRDQMLALASALDSDNNLGCPLN